MEGISFDFITLTHDGDTWEKHQTVVTLDDMEVCYEIGPAYILNDYELNELINEMLDE